MPERVDVPNKFTQLPIINKRGRSMPIKQNYSLLAIEGFHSKIVNIGQPMVDNTLWVNIGYYPVDGCQRHLNNDARISESHDSHFRKSR